MPCPMVGGRGQTKGSDPNARLKLHTENLLLIAVERSYYAGAFACLIDSSQYHTPNVFIKHLHSIWPIDLPMTHWSQPCGMRGWAGPIKLTTGKPPGTQRFTLSLRSSCACALCACVKGLYALFWGPYPLPLPSADLLWSVSFCFWAFFYPSPASILSPTAGRHAAAHIPVTLHVSQKKSLWDLCFSVNILTSQPVLT